jgi:hypothetical protein
VVAGELKFWVGDMAYEYRGAEALDYFPCRYGVSRLTFRGPRRKLTDGYIAVLGGSATYGRFVRDPYPALIEAALDMPVVNFGCMNAGADVFLHDEAVLELCRGARAVVVQITGAQNLSNRFYTVHPRRNDRFVRAHRALTGLYPSVDFTEFNFTRHMLQSLHARAQSRFSAIVAELRAVWQYRMQALIRAVGGPVILLWVADHLPGPADGLLTFEADPLFVDRDMLARLRPMAALALELTPSPRARARGTEGMIFEEIDAPVAAALPGPIMHEEVARALLPHLRDLLAA